MAWEYDTEQTMKPNLLINIKAWGQLGPLVTYEGGTQVLASAKSLLIWEPWGTQSKLKIGGMTLISLNKETNYFISKSPYFILLPYSSCMSFLAR